MEDNRVRTIQSFEDLEVYKMAREFRRKIYGLANRLPKPDASRLSAQMRGAALSVTSNIAEGYGRFHYQENIQFCRQARGSLYELVDQLTACMDERYLNLNEYESLKREAYSVVKMLNGYISATRKRQRNSSL